MQEEEMSGWSLPPQGLIYFLGSPSLWWRPIFTVLVIFVLLLSLFSWVLYAAWPSSDLEWLSYIGHIAKAFGFAITSLLVFWVFVFPIVLNYFFQGYIRAVLKRDGTPVVEEGFFRSVHSSVYILWKTLKWRIFWPLFTLLCTLFFGPLGLIVGHIGMSHITTIDGCDLAFSLQGHEGKERYAHIKRYGKDIFESAIIGGGMSLLLTFTIVGWLFWLPGMLAGAALWSKTKKAK